MPIELPSAPDAGMGWIEELRFVPGLSVIVGEFYGVDMGGAPRCAYDRVARIRSNDFIDLRPGDLRFQGHLAEGDAFGIAVPVLLPPGVVGGLKVALKRSSGDANCREPFDGSHSVVAGDERAERIPVIGREVFSVHGPGDENIGRFAERDAASVDDFAGRNGLLFRYSFVCAFEDDFGSLLIGGRALEQRGERYAGPLGCADRAQLPLNSIRRREEEDSAVARTLKRGGTSFGRHGAELFVCNGEWVSNCAAEVDAVRAGIELRDWEMIAYVEEVVRSQQTLKKLEGGFEIRGSGFADDEAGMACRRGLVRTHSARIPVPGCDVSLFAVGTPVLDPPAARPGIPFCVHPLG